MNDPNSINNLMNFWEEFELEEARYNLSRQKNAHISKECCFQSFYYDHPTNQFSTCCGKRIRSNSEKLQEINWNGERPVVYDLRFKELRLRRRTRHSWCLNCHMHGERSIHTVCGACGSKLADMGSNQAQSDILSN